MTTFGLGPALEPEPSTAGRILLVHVSTEPLLKAAAAPLQAQSGCKGPKSSAEGRARPSVRLLNERLHVWNQQRL